MSDTAAVEGSNYAKVHITLEEDEGVVEFCVSPWNVMIGRDQDGIEWSCDEADFEIEFRHESGTHFEIREESQLRGGPGRTLTLDMVSDLRDPDLVDRMVSGSYDVKVTLANGTMLVVDPDYTRPPRG